jgi:ADP-heptose:LPS heptosyltransferase
MQVRQVEVAWRAFWMRSIAALLPGPAKAAPPDWDARPLRLLYLRYERIGDVIMATGPIRVIKEAHPSLVIDALVTTTTAPVLENNPHVNEVLTLDRKTRGGYLRALRDVARRRYDVVVDGRLNNPPIFTSAPMVMAAARARYRIGTGGGRADLVYNIRIPHYDKRVHYMEASKTIGTPFGVQPADVDWRPEIFLTDAERAAAEAKWGNRRQRRLLVNLSTSEAKRRWPDSKFIAALRFVRDLDPNINIGVMALPSEAESVDKISAAVGARAIRTPLLRHALALVGSTDLVFTPDTGISHAASAFNRPSVVFLPADYHPYAPYDTPGALVFWPSATIESLDVAHVTPALRSLIEHFPSSRGNTD